MAKKKKGQRPDGRCQCKRKMPDGSYKVFYGKNKAEAEVKYKEALMQDAQKKSEAEHFGLVAAEWWKKFTAHIKEGTESTYRSNYQRCVDMFGQYRMDEITPAMVANFGERMKDEGLSVSSIKNARSVLNCIYKHWRIQANATYNPMMDIAPPTGAPKKTREPPTEKELAAFRANPDGFGLSAWMLMYTGLRLGELIALRWGDIDFVASEIHVDKSVSWAGGGTRITTPKTANSVRTVPLLPILRAQIEPRQGPAGQYVIGGLDRPLTDAEYHTRWTTYCNHIGCVRPSVGKTRYRDKRRSAKRTDVLPPVMMPSVTAHQFRHSFASDLYRAGVGEMEAMRILGHADISTTHKIYTHLREREIRGAVVKLEQYYKSE